MNTIYIDLCEEGRNEFFFELLTGNETVRSFCVPYIQTDALMSGNDISTTENGSTFSARVDNDQVAFLLDGALHCHMGKDQVTARCAELRNPTFDLDEPL